MDTIFVVVKTRPGFLRSDVAARGWALRSCVKSRWPSPGMLARHPDSCGSRPCGNLPASAPVSVRFPISLVRFAHGPLVSLPQVERQWRGTGTERAKRAVRVSNAEDRFAAFGGRRGVREQIGITRDEAELIACKCHCPIGTCAQDSSRERSSRVNEYDRLSPRDPGGVREGRARRTHPSSRPAYFALGSAGQVLIPITVFAFHKGLRFLPACDAAVPAPWLTESFRSQNRFEARPADRGARGFGAQKAS